MLAKSGGGGPGVQPSSEPAFAVVLDSSYWVMDVTFVTVVTGRHLCRSAWMSSGAVPQRGHVTFVTGNPYDWALFAEVRAHAGAPVRAGPLRWIVRCRDRWRRAPTVAVRLPDWALYARPRRKGGGDVNSEGSDEPDPETMAQDLLRSLFVQIEWAHHQRGDRERFAVQPGSALAGDNRATAPYQLSHAAVAAMGHSVEHLHASEP